VESFIFNLHQDSHLKGFNAVNIRIDGGLKSDLLWKEAKKEAQKHVSQGYQIFWELDFGIFSSLKHPLSHASQFLSLKLAADHFYNAFWEEFEKHTVGISLYRGSLDFSKDFLWNEEQELGLREWLEELFKTPETLNHELLTSFHHFSEIKHENVPESERGRQLLQLYCRDVLTAYLTLLLNPLPKNTPIYLLLDAGEIHDSVHQANLLSNPSFSSFSLCVKGTSFSTEHPLQNNHAHKMFFDKNSPTSKQLTIAKTALCLPPSFKPSQYEIFRNALDTLIKKKEPFRIIPEALLTAEWDGLDEVIVSEHLLSPQGKRMLQGFNAAGGNVIFLKESRPEK